MKSDQIPDQHAITDARGMSARLRARIWKELEFPDDEHSHIVHPSTFRARRGPEYIVDPTADELQAAVADLLQFVEGRSRARRLPPVDLAPTQDLRCGALRLTGCQGRGHDSVYRCTEFVIAWCTLGRRMIVRLSAIRAGVHHCDRHGDVIILPGAGDRDGAREAWRWVFPSRGMELHEREAVRRRRRIQRLLTSFGPPGDDDRLSILNPHVSAHIPDVGLMLVDNPEHPFTVQVVVRDSSTGLRHAITVPPRFARPNTKMYQRLSSDEARVRAAIAWTFGLRPESYAPTIET